MLIKWTLLLLLQVSLVIVDLLLAQCANVRMDVRELLASLVLMLVLLVLVLVQVGTRAGECLRRLRCWCGSTGGRW